MATMSTRHYTEDELILHYYGEGRHSHRDIPRHLENCESCRSEYRRLADVLSLVVAPEAPERGEQYGLEVWQRLRHQLPERDGGLWSGWMMPRWLTHRLVLASAAA